MMKKKMRKFAQLGLISLASLNALGPSILGLGLEPAQAAKPTTKQNQPAASASQWKANSVQKVKEQIQKEKLVDGYYIVNWGDTLSAISEATNIAIEDLAQVNQIEDVDLIFTGQRLLIDADKINAMLKNGERVSKQERDKFLALVNPYKNSSLDYQQKEDGTRQGIKEKGYGYGPQKEVAFRTKDNVIIPASSLRAQTSSLEHDSMEAPSLTEKPKENRQDQENLPSGQAVSEKPSEDKSHTPSNKEKEEKTSTTPSNETIDGPSVDKGNESIHTPSDKDSSQGETTITIHDEEVPTEDGNAVTPPQDTPSTLIPGEPTIINEDTHEEIIPGDPQVVPNPNYTEPEQPVVDPENADEEVVPTTPPSTEPEFIEVPSEPTVKRTTTKVSEKTDVITAPVRYLADPNLPEGEERVGQEGQDGFVTTQITQTLTDGVVVSETSKEINRQEPVATIIYYGTKVKDQVTVKTESHDTLIRHGIRYVKDDNLEQGKEIVAQEGVDGKVTKTYRVTYTNGVESQRELIDESRTEPIEQVVRYGTKVNQPAPQPEDKPTPKPETKTRGYGNVNVGDTFTQVVGDPYHLENGEVTDKTVYDIKITNKTGDFANMAIDEFKKAYTPEERYELAKNNDDYNHLPQISYIAKNRNTGETHDGVAWGLVPTDETIEAFNNYQIIDIDLLNEEFANLINARRKELGLSQVTYDPKLRKPIDNTTNQLAEIGTIRINGKSHSLIDGSKSLNQYGNLLANENILQTWARDYPMLTSEKALAKEFYTQWMSSPGHKANIETSGDMKYIALATQASRVDNNFSYLLNHKDKWTVMNGMPLYTAMVMSLEKY